MVQRCACGGDVRTLKTEYICHACRKLHEGHVCPHCLDTRRSAVTVVRECRDCGAILAKPVGRTARERPAQFTMPLR